MTARKNVNQAEKAVPITGQSLPLGRFTFLTSRLSLSLCLLLLALLPRAYDLQRFVTADEAKWVYRSAQFLVALLRGDFPATSVNLTPAVTTTWLGSLGLAVYYQFNQGAINQPFMAWLTSLPEFRVDLDILAATRWPMVIFTALSIVVLFLLLSRLFNPALAFLAAAFMALDPHPVALARIIGHDAPTAVFMTLSLVFLLLFLNPGRVKIQTSPTESGGLDSTKPITPAPLLPRASARLLPLIFSAVAAGLAFLSKAPSLFLIPFTGLVLLASAIQYFRRTSANLAASLWRFSWPLIIWAGLAYFTFVVFWPAAWVEPLDRPAAVFQNAFLSATDQEEAGEEGFWRVPDLGPFYYLVNGAFKLSPLVLVGAGLTVVFLAKKRTNPPSGGSVKGESTVLFWLIAFVLLFTLFMTASDKRSTRYILPVFPSLTIVAAYGWLELYRFASTRVAGSKTTGYAHQVSIVVVLTLCALVILWPYAPYYFTYFNPLLGGPFTAPRLVKIGWGEGLDWAGRFLQREDNLRGSRVGTAYASTVAPFFEGDLSSITDANLDYVILYLKQVQAGQPAPIFIRYFEHMNSLFSVELNGIHYADVYSGPTLQVLPAQPRPSAAGPQPLAFRPLTPYGHIGETLAVDVVWPAAEPLSDVPAVVSLTTPISGESPGESHSDQLPALAQAEAQATALAPDLIVSRHSLLLPNDLKPGLYALGLGGRPLGEIELRNFRIPANMNQTQEVVFGQQLAVTAYQFEPTADYLGLNIAWQARSSHLPDYTVFVQILAAETNERLAGVDTPPLKGAWPTSRWVKGEVVVDKYLVAIPPGFAPGFYKVIVGLYQPETGQRLPLADGQDHWTLPWTFIRK